MQANPTTQRILLSLLVLLTAVGVAYAAMCVGLGGVGPLSDPNVV